MSALINKIWYYTPNQYTTNFELTALFEDGHTSVYAFQKSGTSWEPVNPSSHDGRLLITVPDGENNSFHVRAYTNDPFVSLSATYSNATSSATATDVMLKRFKFDKSYTYQHPYYRYLQYPNNDIWQGFPSDMQDIFLTNLTDYVIMPTPKIEGTPLERVSDKWYGWAIVNGSVSLKESQNMEGSQTDKRIPAATYIHREFFNLNLSKLPLKSTLPVGADTTNSISGERDILEVPNLGGVYKMLPIYIDGVTRNFYLDNRENDIHLLEITAQNGEVTATGECQRVKDGWEVPDGGNVTLTATADDGYMFSTWSDGNTNAERTITNITEDTDLTATFVAL